MEVIPPVNSPAAAHAAGGGRRRRRYGKPPETVGLQSKGPTV